MENIKAIQCNKCKDIIYSRTKNDMRFCSCGSVSIDGGFEYLKASGNMEDIKILNIELKNCSKQSLYNDWAYNINKYGKINEKIFNEFVESGIIYLLKMKNETKYEYGWLI